MKTFLPASALALGLAITFPQALSAAQGDGTEPQTRQRGPGSEAFMERFDTDGDGQISETEKQNARDTLKTEGKRPGRNQEERRQKMLEKFDTNGDGQLDETERNAARQAMMIKRFDADGDGQLNADEQAKADEQRQKILDRFDKDGDGKLNKQERNRARKALHRHRKQNGGGQGRPSQDNNTDTPGLPYLNGNAGQDE